MGTMRRNGFQRPYHVLQLVSWFVFSYLGLSFHFVLLPAFATWQERLGLTLAYWCVAGPMVVYGWRMTRSEALDQLIIDARETRARQWQHTPPVPGVYDFPLDNESTQEREERRCDPAVHALSAELGPAGHRNWCPYCYEHVHPTSKHCFTEDHQVLTSRGFLSLSEILHLLPQFDPDAMDTSASASDSGPALLFASYDPTSQAIVYAPTSGVVIKTATELIEFTQSAEAHRWAADADAYGFTPQQVQQHQASSNRQRTGKKLVHDKSNEGSKHSNHLSIIVDPGHEMFVKKGSADKHRHHTWDGIHVRDHPVTDQGSYTYEERPYEKHAAASLVSTDKTACLKMLAVASAGANVDSSNRCHFTQALGLKTETQIVAFLEVYGYWLGAGALDSSPRSVQFSLKTTQDKKWLKRRLERVGLSLEAGDYETTRTQTNRLQVDVTAPAWLAYFCKEYKEAAEVQSTSAKWMWSWVWRLAKQDVRSILVGLRYADGQEASSDENVIYTSSVRFRDEIQRAALHAGYASRIHLAHKKDAHRGLPSGSSALGIGASWCVTYSEQATAAETVLDASTDVKRVAVPDGVKVWCVTVNPHNLIIVRRVGVDDDGVVTKASVPVIVGNCKICDKCVSQFDHHCKWLNTCVGGRNYHLFFSAMSFALLLLAYQCGLSLYFFISTWLDDYHDASAGHYIRAQYGQFNGTVFRVLCAITILLSAPLFLSLLQLFGLHVYLWRRGVSTYDWIMERREALRLQEEANARAVEQAEAERRNQSAPAAAAAAGAAAAAPGTGEKGGIMLVSARPLDRLTPGGQPQTVETPRPDEAGRHTTNLPPGETDVYPEYARGLKVQAEERRRAEMQHQQQQQQLGIGNGLAQSNRLPLPGGGGDVVASASPASLYGYGGAPPRTMTVTAAEVQLASANGQTSTHHAHGRPTSASSMPYHHHGVSGGGADGRTSRSQTRHSRSNSQERDGPYAAQPAHHQQQQHHHQQASHSYGDQGLGRHAVGRSRPSSAAGGASAAAVAGASGGRSVHLHLGPRSSLSRARASPPLPAIHDTFLAAAAPAPSPSASPSPSPIGSPSAVSTHLVALGGALISPPSQTHQLAFKPHQPMGSSAQPIETQYPPQQQQQQRPLPGTVVESPTRVGSSGTLSPPAAGGFSSSSAPGSSMPLTPTAAQLGGGGYSLGVPTSTLPPPSVLATTSTLHGGRTMEEEAAAFLADPTATEPNFQQTMMGDQKRGRR